MSKFALRAYKTIIDILFPIECLGCESPGAFLCEECMKFCAYTSPLLVCPVCLERSVVGSTHPKCASAYTIDGIFAATSFKNPLAKNAIKKFKYKNVGGLKYDLAQMIAYHLDANFSGYILQNHPTVTYVPLHPKRLRQRGYNQSELLAQELCRQSGFNFSKALIRNKNTHDQTLLNKAERLENMKGAFSVSENALVKDVSFFVIDDVSTTGATLKECAKVLKRNGAKEVWGVALAKD